MKNLFIPQYIGDFSLFTQRIVALELTETEVLCALVVWHGKRKTIEKVLQEPISQDAAIALKDRSIAALKRVMEQIGSYTKIIAVVPSSKVIFKEISVPAMSWQKIKMLLPFEIEPLLPFSLDQAMVDGVIVQQGSQEQKTEVLVAAVKQDVMQELLGLLADAQIKPHIVTTDLVELYSFYRALPEYVSDLQTTLILDLEPAYMRLLLLVDGKLSAFRVIPQGLDRNEQDSYQALFAMINVTVESFLAKVQKEHIEKIILCGKGVEMPGMQELVTERMHAPCHVASLMQLLHEGIIQTKQELAENNRCIVPVTAALSFAMTEDFNLDTHAADQQVNSLLTKQLIITLVLIGGLFIMLLTNSIITQRNLSEEFVAREQQAINHITQQLNLVLPKAHAGKKTTLTIDQVNNLALAKVVKEEELWFTLSSQNRFLFLDYLQELSTRINRQDLGLELRQLVMTEDAITLEGRVKNFEALRTFEEDLNQSKMFKSIQKPQDLKFVVKMVLDKSQREEA